jgi:hypothetical protein
VAGVNEQAIDFIQLSPNPTNDIISISNLEGNELFELRNQQGQNVPFQQIENQISLKNLKSGVYFLTICKENTTKTLKVIRN